MSSLPESRTPRSVGVLGAGQIVVDVHLPTLLAMPRVRVAWIADARNDRARAIARAFGLQALELPESVIDLPQTDLVLVAVPYGARDRYYRLRRGRGTALYVEKPFARTVAQHIDQCAGLPETHTAIGFQRRCWGPIRFVRDVIRGGAFGPLQAVRVGHGYRGVLTGSSYSANFALAGGGILFEAGIHWLDAALFITDAADVDVMDGTMVRHDGFDLHTQATLSVSVGGRDVTMDLIVSGLTDTIRGIELEFEHGRLLLAQDGRVTMRPRRGLPFELRGEAHAYPTTPIQLAYEHWTGVLDALDSGSPNWTSASHSLLTTKAVEGLYSLPS